MPKKLDRIGLRDIMVALYLQKYKDTDEKFALLCWNDFKLAMLRSGLISTVQTARSKWFKLSTVPEIFTPQKDENLVAVDIVNLRAAIEREIDRTKMYTAEVIRW